MHSPIDVLLHASDCRGDPELRVIAELAPDALRRRWRSLLGGPIPLGLGRSLILCILAYRSQAQRYGDLDLASQRALSAWLKNRPAAVAVPADPPGISVSDAVAQGPTGVRGRRPSRGSSATVLIASPGTVLVRQHAGSMHRVMVLDEGFAWNGRTYESLSKVAFAITGTQWNGPRFFGLRAAKQASHSS